MSPIQWKTTVPPRPFETARVWKVAASAGCGKTFTVERCINELLDSGVRPDEIMYVTFNKLPAVEFRARFPSFSPEQTRWWNTHHSVCLRLLRDAGRPAAPMSDADWSAFGERHGYDFVVDEDGFEDNGSAKKLRDDVSTKLCDGRELDDGEEMFLSRLRSFEQETGKVSFISMMSDALSSDLFPPSVRFVFVDEAQDNGSVQSAYWERVLSTNCQVAGFMLVGDDKQAINGFKGGNAESFLSFPADESVSFDTSYRCPIRILELANEIASPIRVRSPLVGKSASPFPGVVLPCERFDLVAEDLREDVSAGKSVLVLCRTNATVQAAKGVLARADIPYHSAETERIRRVFRAFSDIRRTGLITSSDMAVLAPFSEVSAPHKPGDLSLKCEYYDHARRKAVLLARKEAGSRRVALADELSGESDDIKIEDAISRGFTDRFVMDVCWAQAPDPSFFLGPGMDRKVGMVSDWIAAYGLDYPVVRTVTIHGSKGSEADVVVLIGDISQFMEDNESSDTENERRVWYVAVTRSKEKVYLSQLSRNAGFTRFL